MFSAGQMLAGRYRIVSRLGGGGMGEVYRADDLALGASVALKFLPADAIARPGWLDRFRSEVRLTRQISHPSVCRVYDIAEVEGRVFLSMEFVDGEDLASLIRRIGRLPQDKAVEIARQICFGLAAAHELGVVHRDLKPANIMLDGRGNARVMDFGVAGFAAELNARGHVSAGTPAYMAPEQLEGREISRKSDLYSLGLVLYELFTGKPAFSPQTMEELRRTRLSGTRPTDPSSVVAGLDPAVERVILHCLEPDPAMRPASAVAVAAALPGGDPLAAALAAGETPSPELVAASGEAGTLRPAVVGILLALGLAMLAAVVVLRDRLSLLHTAPVEFSPDVLVARAREHMKQLGYTRRPASESYGFQVRSSLLRAIQQEDQSPERWNKLAEPGLSPLSFWYRSSDLPLQPVQWWQMNPSVDDPPMRRVGDVAATLDVEGRLRTFMFTLPSVEVPSQSPADSSDRRGALSTSEPPQGTTPQGAAAKPLDAADMRALVIAATAVGGPYTDQPPASIHAVPSESRIAFTASIESKDPIPVTIEAASARGKVVSIETLFPWTTVQRTADPGIGMIERAATLAGTTIQLILLACAVLLARRNLITNRADRRGGFRVALAAALIGMAASLLLSTWTGNVAEVFFGPPLVRCVFHAGLWWVSYIAVEPIIRRVWPHAIIAWSRLLEGRWRDPLVGRDVLIGILAGFGALLLAEPVSHAVTSLMGLPPPVPFVPNTISLAGSRFALGQVIDGFGDAIVITLLASLGMVVTRAIFRKPILIIAAIFLCMYLAAVGGPFQDVPYRFLLAIPWAALPTYIFTQRGLLSGAAMLATAFLILRLPVTLDMSRWYAGSTIILTITLLAALLYAARTTLGRQSLFSRTLLDG